MDLQPSTAQAFTLCQIVGGGDWPRALRMLLHNLEEESYCIHAVAATYS
jgi:hypothetical protein